MALKMCDKHWSECRQAIENRGLSHLVSKNGEDLGKRMMSAEKRGYDPLMDLNMMITSQAVKCGGLGLMMCGEYLCPLCEGESQSGNKSLGTEWINGASDAILDYCKNNNLQG